MSKQDNKNPKVEGKEDMPMAQKPGNGKGGRKHGNRGKGGRPDNTSTCNTKWNSEEWYNHNPDLVDAVANISLATMMGSDYQLGGPKVTTGHPVASTNLLTLYCLPTIGFTSSRSDPINIASQQLVAHMRAQISGSRNYQVCDVTMHILKIASLYSMLNMGWRAYRFARTYDRWDQKSPDNYLKCMGFDPSNVKTDVALAKFYDVLTQLCLKLQTFHLPKNFPYINRLVEISSNVFKDSDTDKATKYMWQPIGYYEYSAPTQDRDPRMVLTKWWSPGNPLRTIDEFADMINAGIDSALNNDYFWIIQGDLDKAIGDNYTFNVPGRDEVGMPEFAPNLQLQLENMTIFNGYDQDSFTIYQRPAKDMVECDPIVHLMSKGATSDRIINFHWNKVTPMNVMYATRYMAYVTDIEADTSSAGGFNAHLKDGCPAEIVVQATVVVGAGEPRLITGDYSLSGDFEGTKALVQAISAMSSIDWHPAIYVWEEQGPPADALVGNIEDLDNWTIMPRSVLKDIHNVATLSLWGVPRK